MQFQRAVPIALLSLLSAACGDKGGMTGPDAVPERSARETGSATSLTFVSGGTDLPVIGATVNVAGNAAKTSDSEGRVILDRAVPEGTPYDAVASGYLPRLSLIRSVADTEFSLWPVGRGFDEAFVGELVYNEWVPGRRLSRPAADTVYLRLSPQLAADPKARKVHVKAAEVLTAATEGAITYAVSEGPPVGSSVYDMLVDPAIDAGAQTHNGFSGNIIIGEKIVYRSMTGARSLNTVAHELGHTFGLGHVRDVDALMNVFGTDAVTDFSAPEKLAIRMMLQRHPGTAFPDNDRDAQAMRAFRRTIVIPCER